MLRKFFPRSCKSMGLAGFMLLANTAAAHATNYYVDASNGNDMNDGRSPAKAWRAVEKVNAFRFNPGDSVLFKRGELWRARLIVPSSGAPNRPITFGAYGHGEKPVINGAQVLANWVSEGKNIWSAAAFTPEYDTEINLVLFDGKLGDRKAARTDLQQELDWWYHASGKRLYVYLKRPPGEFNPPGIEASAQFGVIYLNNQDYVAISGLALKYSNNNAIKTHEDDSDHILIEDCLITQNAGTGMSGHPGSDDWIVRNNTITYCGAPLDRDGLYVHPNCNRWRIHDNVFAFNGGDDIALEGGSGHRVFRNTIGPSRSVSMGLAVEGGSDFEIYENEIFGHDLAGIGIKAANCKVFRNRIHGNSGDGVFINNSAADSGLEIYYNLIWGQTGRGFSGISFWVGGSNARISNNVLFGNDIGIAQHQNQQNLTIVNNVIMSNARSGFHRSAGTQRLAHNNCYGNGVNYSGVPDPTGRDGNLSVDPLFRNAALYDFRLTAESPCIDAGREVGYAQDFIGNALPQGAGIDIGACEYKNISPPQNVRMLIKP